MYRRNQAGDKKGGYENKTLLRVKRGFSFFPRVLAIAVFSFALVATAYTPVLAVNKVSTQAPSQQASSFAYYKAMWACLNRGEFKNMGNFDLTYERRSMSQQNAIDYDFFSKPGWTNNATIGAFQDKADGDGLVTCHDSEGKAWIKNAISAWGYSGGPDFLCAIGFTRQSSGSNCRDTPSGANNNYIAPDASGPKAASNLNAQWTSSLGSSGTSIDAITGSGGAYRLYLENFMAACKPSAGGTTYTIMEASAGKMVEVKYGAGDTARGQDYKVGVYEGRDMTCGELASAIGSSSQAAVKGYAVWLAENPAGETKPNGTENSAEEGDTQSSCSIAGIGWIICPVVTFLADAADSAYDGLAENFLKVPTSLVSTDSTVFSAWQAFLGLANAVLVIAFLTIIFSQLTGAGISNYGVKKMLPRLIVVAILMNISFFICQISVDLSNILGVGLKSLLSAMGEPLASVPSNDWATGSGGIGLAGVGVAVLGGGAAAVGAAGGATLALIALIGLLVGAVLTLVGIFFALVIRQALVLLLVVLAPLAFAAFLLPNTEQWFTRWRKLFVASLLLFPVIGLVFGASTLASNILLGVYGGTGNVMGQIIAAAVLILPLIAVPLILKGALNVLGKFGGQISAIGGKASGYAKQHAGGQSFKQHAQNVSQARKAGIATGHYRGRGGNFNPNNWRSKANANMNSRAGFNLATSGYGAQRSLAAQQQQRKDAAEAMQMFGGDEELMKVWAATGGNLSKAKDLKGSDGKVRLGTGQLQQFAKMRQAGHDMKATSHLAVAQYLSENGKGSDNVVEVKNALANAAAMNADSATISGAEQSALAAYRKSGRGDAVASLSNYVNREAIKKGEETPMSMVTGWKQIAPGSVHREGLAKKADGSDTDGRAAYKSHLAADRGNTEQALRGYDSMESRAKGAAQELILDAARAHAGTTGEPISTIEDAKARFGIQ